MVSFIETDVVIFRRSGGTHRLGQHVRSLLEMSWGGGDGDVTCTLLW